jgi:hypothetical protein
VQCLRTNIVFEPECNKSVSVCAEAVWGSGEVSIRTNDFKNDYLRHTIQLSIHIRQETLFFGGI